MPVILRTKEELDVRKPKLPGDAKALHRPLANDALVAEAVEIVGIAAETNLEIAAEHGYALTTTVKSLGLLEVISTSLKHDLAPE